MVCDRCKMVVAHELQQSGFRPVQITLGEVELAQTLTDKDVEVIKESLKKVGFELINDQKSKLINQVKTLVIDFIHHGKPNVLKMNMSMYLAQQIGRDYSYLSNLFSEVEGTTVEQYIILQRIEKAKELMVYGEKNVSEIATQLGYSSVAHLSNQFKKVTGLTPSHFKSIGSERRKSLDAV